MLKSISARGLLRIVLGILGLGACIYFAIKGNWTAAFWVLILVALVSGKGLAEMVLRDGESSEWTPYDELKLEAVGIGVLAVLFLLGSIALLVGVISIKGNRYVNAGLCFVGMLGAASVVIVTFKYPPARYRPYMESKGKKSDPPN